MAVTQARGASFRDDPNHYFGKTNDTKPVGSGVPNGSTYKETDGELRLWRYDAEEQKWNIDTHSGGGGGGGDEDSSIPLCGLGLLRESVRKEDDYGK